MKQLFYHEEQLRQIARYNMFVGFTAGAVITILVSILFAYVSS